MFLIDDERLYFDKNNKSIRIWIVKVYPLQIKGEELQSFIFSLCKIHNRNSPNTSYTNQSHFAVQAVHS
jgi:hypothetical protein